MLRSTAPVVYVRMHGPDQQHLYGRPTPTRTWLVGRPGPGMDREGKDVFIYFNNDGEGNAVRNADTLRRLLID